MLSTIVLFLGIFLGTTLGVYLGFRAVSQHLWREFDNKMTKDRPESVMSIKNDYTGAEIIMPNPVKEAFDAGHVESIKDIL